MILFDTSIIVELLQKREHQIGAISIITLIEVLRGLETKKSLKIKELLEKSFNILNIDNEVIQVYCSMYHELRDNGVSIPDADLLIAATAISHNLSMRTKDKHFERLKELGLNLA
jgi:predicted nucleic acid-binding protein